MFIECARHKSKIQRNPLYCVEKCARKCEAFFALEPETLTEALRENPERGHGHQLEMFRLDPPPPKRKRP
jgi:hypothetical protein